jgi:hypothetical protein
LPLRIEKELEKIPNIPIVECKYVGHGKERKIDKGVVLSKFEADKRRDET